MKHNLSRRQFMQLSAGVASGALLAACAAPGAPQPAGGEAAPAQEVVTITFLALHDGWPNVWEDFYEVHPDVKVEADFLPWDAFFEQVQVRLASGSGDPDVYEVDVPLTASYGFREWLVPLDDLFTEDEINDWIPAAYQAGKYEGELISAPMRTSTQLLYYNKNLLDQAGIEPPGEDERWTWEQLAEAAKAATVDSDGDGVPETWGFIWEQIIRIYQLQPMPMSLGGVAIGDDGLTVRGIIDSPEWIEAFTYYSNAFNEWRFAPQGEVGWPTDTLFRGGKLAFALAGSWNITDNEDADFEWGVSRHPYFEAGEIVTPTGSWHIGINSASTNPEAGAKLVHWSSTMPGVETVWRKAFFDMPAQKSLLEKWMTDPEFDERPAYFNRIAANEATVNPQPRPVTPGYLEYEEILGDTFEDIRNGADVSTALGRAVDRIEAEMVKYS
jgi:ABC-type glycerol-3-phosphate transport system substrate-binding protein